MDQLILAGGFWLAVHIGLAGTRLRWALAGAVGEGAFRIGYSLLSVAAIWFLVSSYNLAETDVLWVAPDWLHWLAVVLMLPAFLLFFGAVTAPNPTAAGQEKAVVTQVRGIQRITRHPMLCSFALWALLHLANNGDSASLVFFGAFAVTALVGMPSIDAKVARRNPAAWAKLKAETSILPFGAILAGRNRLAPAEIGWLAPLLAVLAWAALMHFHAQLFGVAPVSFG